MPPIGWIDFSSEHRDKVRTVIDMLATRGVIDELGIGAIRDSFADRMFPGLSTIQTRPKYFLLTVLLLRKYQDKESNKRRPRTLERFLEEEERWCRIELVKRHGDDDGPGGRGIIGRSFGTRADRGVVRRPSSIYWNGLRQYGMISPPHLSLAEFGRRLSDPTGTRQLQALLEERGDDRGDDRDAEDRSHMLSVAVPDVADDYWDDLSIDLTRSEAEFLREYITVNQPDSLIGNILQDDAIMDEVLRLPESAVFDDFAELPFLGKMRDTELRRTVEHARDFWRIMEGAHIRYNCLLQNAKFGTSGLQAKFEAQWQAWRDSVVADFPTGWDSAFMWALVSKHGSQPKPSTRRFVDRWIEETRKGVPDLAICDGLVTGQERINKGNRARLRPGNREAINDWMGLNAVNYRLGEVRTMIADIRAGETRHLPSQAQAQSEGRAAVDA